MVSPAPTPLRCNIWLRPKTGRLPLSWLQQRLRSEVVSSQIVDLTTCGAVPPYNELLCGKLVALSALSKEMQESLYGELWKNAVYNCFMHGGASRNKENIYRGRHHDKLMARGAVNTTASKLRSDDFESLNYDLAFAKWGESKGFGTFGFSLSCREALQTG